MARTVQHTMTIGGMTCANCERIIERKVRNAAGVQQAKVDYTQGTLEVSFDPTKTNLEKLSEIIAALGYQPQKTERASTGKTALQLAAVVILLLGAFLLMRHLGLLDIMNRFPQAKEGMGYGVLLVIGLLTSLHCVAMCGGINLSQCANAKSGSGAWGSMRASVLYNLGRVVSYTVIGGLVGALGSVISFSGMAKGIVQTLAGVFMIVMGLNMLGMFPFLRKLTPRLPKALAARIQAGQGGHGPLIIGLLNGLMPCAPLQAMQLYALSTHSLWRGALSMLLFSLGTVPLMFGLGTLSTLMSRKFAHRMALVSAVLVALLGVAMLQSGLSLSGVSLGASPVAQVAATQDADEATQSVTSQVFSRSYEPITVKAGVPVAWTLHVSEGNLNGCNNAIVVPTLGIEKVLEVGDNVVEFTPATAGTIPFSCWMGMIRSSITVTE